MKKTVFVLSLALVLAAASVAFATIQPGEERSVVGTVSAVDAQANALVVEVPVQAGMLTVGVTMQTGATIMRDGRSIKLGDLRMGERVSLKYTRVGDQLRGLEVMAR